MIERLLSLARFETERILWIIEVDEVFSEVGAYKWVLGVSRDWNELWKVCRSPMATFSEPRYSFGWMRLLRMLVRRKEAPESRIQPKRCLLHSPDNVMCLFCSSRPACGVEVEDTSYKKTVNPEWDEELTFSVEDPSVPVKLEVYDKDRFSADDPMGDAEFDIKPFFEAVKMDLRGAPPPDGSVLRKQASTRLNCLAEESSIYLLNGKVVQDIVLRLRNVECGEIELQLQWVDLPSSKSS
ncbi:hypothetical protein KFK09_028747 [Dendrobium nobile]|uniref:C2 domain-containing protein n=1 Tax=Dendrobium nobile TaxID=94219 RepID=A0A8T3A3B0_DENNO|nr:hypothetical protein KFK09_028747 [Dendrobium nobile]